MFNTPQYGLLQLKQMKSMYIYFFFQKIVLNTPVSQRINELYSITNWQFHAHKTIFSFKKERFAVLVFVNLKVSI